MRFLKLILLLFIFIFPKDIKADSYVPIVRNIAVNTGTIDPNSNLGKAINAYNLGMAVIGVKNLAVGGYKFVVVLPENTKNLLQQNKGIRDLLVAQYTQWKTLTTNLDNLSSAQKQLVTEQEKVWKALGVAIKIERFIAKTGEELKAYLNTLSDLPKGETYVGDLYRSLSLNSEKEYFAVPEKMTSHDVYSSWGRYDLEGEENAMYLSKTLPGNQTELSAYGEWTNFSTYKFENIKADNLLNLTDDAIRQKLGTQFDDLVKTLGTQKK